MLSTGIGAAIIIQLTHRQDSSINLPKESAVHYSENNGIYTISDCYLLDNYRDFLVEFYELIDEDLQCTGYTLMNVPVCTSISDFYSQFRYTDRNQAVQLVPDFKATGYVSMMSWLFYIGCVMTDFGSYQMMSHFERAIKKGMRNPLRDVVRVGWIKCDVLPV